jgi:uncharacterized protein involved in exopolysaccharide biosynthesis
MRHEHIVLPKPMVGSDDLGLAQVVALLTSNRRVIIGSVLTSLVLAIAYLLIATPQYTATAMLLIDTRTNTLNTPPVRPTDANSESAYVETQVGILNSERIARAVIVEQKLFDFQEPKPGTQGAPAAAPAGPAVGDNSTNKDFDSVSPAAVREFRRSLAVKRNPSTYIIEVSFTFPDPEKAAAIANGVSTAYIADQLKSREETSARLSQWLRQRTTDLRRETQAAETALEEFRHSNPGVGLGSSRNTLRDLESTAQTYRMISDSFQKQSVESAQQLYFLSPDARFISKAWPPSDRSYPKRALTFAVAIALGLASGFMIALARGVIARKEPEAKAA